MRAGEIPLPRDSQPLTLIDMPTVGAAVRPGMTIKQAANLAGEPGPGNVAIMQQRDIIATEKLLLLVCLSDTSMIFYPRSWAKRKTCGGIWPAGPGERDLRLASAP
jgi:hypothetical protein